MGKMNRLQFSLKDSLFNTEVSPSNLTLPLLSEFVEDVSAFIRGSHRPDLSEIKTSILEGSVTLLVEDEIGALTEAHDEYLKVKDTQDVTHIDPARARVLEKWRSIAIESDRTYSLGKVENNKIIDTFVIDATTKLKEVNPIWVNVEKYVYGRIYDMGGKSRTNIHIQLDNGASIKVGSTVAKLLKDDKNRLYRNQLVRIKAEKNIDTGEFRNEKLISFESYNPVFDEDVFERVSKKAKIAWKSVGSATEWVENLRGNSV